MPLLADGLSGVAGRPTVPLCDFSGCCTWPWRWGRSLRTTSATTTSARRSSVRRRPRGDPGRRSCWTRCPATGRTTREQADGRGARAGPDPVAGGIHELELAIDVMAAYYNDTRARLPVNLPNIGGALPGFDEDTAVEVWCDVDRPAPVHPRSSRCPTRPGDHPDSWRSSRAGGRGGLGRHPRRRHTGADRAPFVRN